MAKKEFNIKKITSRIKVPKSMIPRKFQKKLEIDLVRANIRFASTEWVGMFSLLGIILLIFGSILSTIFSGFMLFVFSLAMMVMIPRIKADKRRGEIEEALPDALHHMAVSIRTGLVLESVVQEIAESNYGALSDEFQLVVLEMRKGRQLKDAMLSFSARSDSKQVERAMRLLLEGIESGGPISEVLDEVSDDIRAVRLIQRERKSMTSQQISFLVMASVFAGPFVMGVVASLPDIMVGALEGPQADDFPLEAIQTVISALTFYVIAQALSASVMMGVVMYGNFKKGFKFAPPMILAAYTIFFVIKTVMPGSLGSF